MEDENHIQPQMPINAFDLVKDQVPEPSIEIEWTVKDVLNFFEHLSHDQAKRVLLAAKHNQIEYKLNSAVMDALQNAASAENSN